MIEQTVIRVSAVVMRDGTGRVLNVRKRGTSSFMLPGGKPESGETPESAAIREFLEEIGIALDPSLLRDLGVFRADAANEPSTTVEAHVFEHPYVPEASRARAHAEIAELKWVDPRTTHPAMAPLNTERIFPLLTAGITDTRSDDSI